VHRSFSVRSGAASEFSIGRLTAFVLYGVLAGAPYALIYNADIPHMLRGAVAGGFIAAGVALFELLFLQADAGKRLQAGPFGVFLAARIGAWTVVIVAGLVAGRVLVPLGEGLDLANPQILVDIAFSFIISFIAMSALAVTRLLGTDVIAALLSGRYYRPQTEQRVFLILDMVGSTALADRFGDKAYLGVLNRLLQEITPVIARSGGEIHRYIGDAVIITWRPRLDLARAATAAVECAIGCITLVRRSAARFEADFGIAPGFRAAVHLGPVIAAEIGTVKREIAFVGDTMNTLARIEQAGREAKQTIVLSQDVLAAAALPPGVRCQPLGDFALRGKQERITLHALELAPA
jgi:adenylate cyclase